MKRLILIFSIALPALAQTTVTTVPTFANLVTQIPSVTRPQVRVLGGASANDGLGYDVIWDAASSAPTNTWALGGPLAYPWGATTGRWKALESTLWSPSIKGTSEFNSITILEDPNTAAGTSATTKVYVDTAVYLTRIYADVKSPAMVNNLTALLAVGVSNTESRVGYVRQNTGSDGAAGQWLWDPYATAAESAVVKKSTNLSPTDPGRWIKY